MLRLPRLTLRRTTAAIAMTGAAVLIPTIALASSGTAAVTAHPAGSAAATTARCHTGSLTDWIGLPADGTAGSNYYMLEISNTSKATCTLYGAPGVSAVGVGGHQLGRAASRNYAWPELHLTLTPGETVHAVLQIVDPANYPVRACRPATADGLRVYAPGAYRSEVIPFSFRTCANRGPTGLYISATLGGTGIPGQGD